MSPINTNKSIVSLSFLAMAFFLLSSCARIKEVPAVSTNTQTGSSPVAAEANTEPGQGLELVRLSLYEKGDSAEMLHTVALKKGFFADAGINLVTLRKKDNLSMSEIFLMGRTTVYQIESTTPGLIKAFNFNTQDSKRWNDAILVRKKTNISSLGQMKPGSTVGLIGGGPAREPLMKLMLKNSGVDPETVKLEPLIYSDVPSTIGVVYARDPSLSLLLANGNWEMMIDEPLFAKNILSPWPMSMTLFSADFIKEKPALAKKVLSVYDRTIDYIRQNPAEADEIMTKYIEEQFGIKGIKVRQVNYLKYSEIDSETIQKQSDWYAENKLSKGKIDAKSLIFNEALLP